METDYKKYAFITASIALVFVAFAAAAMGLTDIKSWRHPNGAVATITVTGEGEVTAPPDIATITATVRESAKTVPEAQKLVETKINKALDAVSALGVDKKDTKTLSYTVNPKYEQQNAGYCVGYVCPPTKSIVVGYEVAQSIQVKVRKIDSSGEVVSALGKANIAEINGPDFTVDDMEKPKAEAKIIAIKVAQDKAKATAKALGVSLGEITQFSEDNGGNYPMMYGLGGAVKASVDSVTLPQGESVIKSNVTITYSLD